MYILVIGRAYPKKETGMMGIFELEQALALSNHDHKVIYSFCDTRSVKVLRKYGPVNLKSENIPAYGYHLPIGGLPKGIFNKIKKSYFERVLETLVKREGIPDLIYIHFPLLTLNEGIWNFLKSLNSPMVVTEHWSKVLTKDLLPEYIGLLKKIVVEADEFMCVGEPLKKSIIELTQTKRDIKVMPNMVSSLFYYEPKEKSDIFNFIALGRMVKTKRFELIIKAFNKAFDKKDNVRLTIAGNGPQFKANKKLIDELGEDDRIHLPGFLERKKVADLIRKSDAFVSASVLETFGVPYIEAMACGKPIIGVKGGAIDPYINDGNGILVRENDVDGLVDALRYIFENKDIFDGEKIAKNTAEIFSEESIIKELDEIFTTLRSVDYDYKN